MVKKLDLRIGPSADVFDTLPATSPCPDSFPWWIDLEEVEIDPYPEPTDTSEFLRLDLMGELNRLWLLAFMARSGGPAGWLRFPFLHARYRLSRWQFNRRLVLEGYRPIPQSFLLGRGDTGQRGFALLELLLVLGVIAAALASAVALYRYVEENRKIGAETERAAIITQALTSFAITSADFSTVNQANALRMGLFPREMLNYEGKPKSAWGGDVLLTSSDLDDKQDWGAVLTYEGVPASACAKFVSAAAGGFYSVAVDNEPVRAAYGALDTPMLAKACGSGEVARVQFTYAKNGGAGTAYSAIK